MSEDVKKLVNEQLGETRIESPDFDVERKKEKIEQISEIKNDKKEDGIRKVPTDQKTTATAQPVSQKEADFAKIESILEEDLEDIYFNLPPERQGEFKRKGEETAESISLVLQKTKIKVSRIINLIKDWLKLIPGVNKFFLEQEAKIKADKIIDLKKR